MIPAPAEVDQIVERVAARAQAADAARAIPVETINELAEAGVFGLLSPRKFGGDQAELPPTLDLIARLGGACTSTGWVTGFYIVHNWLLTLFPPEVPETLFADRPYVLAPAALSPTGTATVSDSGYRLSGRWPWGTGSTHADWMMVTSLIREGEDVVDARMLLLPFEGLEVVDTWKTDGMRATASHDVVIAECEVPREFTLAVLDSREGFAEPAERFDDGLYGLPLVPLLALAATAPALGAAEAALASFIARTQTRVLAYSFTQAREAVGPRMRIGACHSRVAAIRSLFDRLVARVESARQGGERLTLAERAEIRLGCSLIVHESRQIVDELCAGAGASVHFLDHPLQRTQRDLNTLCGHVMFDRDTSQELFGSVAVGMELPPLAML